MKRRDRLLSGPGAMAVLAIVLVACTLLSFLFGRYPCLSASSAAYSGTSSSRYSARVQTSSGRTPWRLRSGTCGCRGY